MSFRTTKRTIAAAAAAALLAVGGGAAIAANAVGSPAEESDAIVADAASQLGVKTTALTPALKQALGNRVDAALADGRITEEQAAELKERIASDDFPLLGLRGPGGHGGHHAHIALEAAAAYLGVTEAELRASLEDGDTLADVAEAEGKAVDGLVDALVAAEEERLAADVEAGRITDARRDEIVASLRERVTELVNRTRPPRPDGGFRGGWGPPSG